MNRGIIVSIQGYHYKTISELIVDAMKGGAVGIRTDKKPISRRKFSLIGLRKALVSNPREEAYITPTIEDVKKVEDWAGFIAVDCRQLNKYICETLFYCEKNGLRVIADIQTIHDYLNLKNKGLKFEYVATTFSPFNPGCDHYPDFNIIKELIEKGEENIIAEGNFQTREQVKQAFDLGVKNVCIGGAIANVYKLTRKFVTAMM